MLGKCWLSPSLSISWFLSTGEDEHPLPATVEPVGGHTHPTTPQHPPLPTTASNESLYESCSSQVDPSSPAKPVQSTPTLTLSPCAHVTGSPRPQTEPSATVVKKANGSRIPKNSLVPSRDDVSTPTQATSTLTSPSLTTIKERSHEEEGAEQPGRGGTYTKKQENRGRALARVHIKNTPPLMTRDSPAGPFDAAYTLSPMGAPYLKEGYTPKTLMKMQEEYRARTKGKLVSLAELNKARLVCTNVSPR